MTMRGEVHGLYTITCLINSKVYVGRSLRPIIRLKSHRAALQGGYHFNKVILGDYLKYGEDSFEFMIVANNIDGFEIKDAEAKLAEVYFLQGKSYNINRPRSPCLS